MPPQVLTASMILFCRCGNKQRLLEFLKWKTAAEKEDLNRWASDVVKWKEQAKENVCRLYEDGNATVSLRRAAVLVTKFTNERSLHGWVEEINVTLGVSPDTTVIMQELPKHGLEGKPRNATDSQRQHRSSAIFAEVAETMGCSRRPNSDWREVESEGVAGEGVNVVTPLPILARPRAGKGTHYFSRDFETDRQWFLNRVLNQRFSGEPQTSASFASTLTSPKNCYGSDVAELSAAPSDPFECWVGCGCFCDGSGSPGYCFPCGLASTLPSSLFGPPLVWNLLHCVVQGSSGHALLNASYGAECRTRMGWNLALGRPV